MSFASVLSQFKKPRRRSRSSASSSSMDTENTSQVASSLDIAARNSMALPIMMRDMNVMKQGILKLVKIAGGTQRDKADRFFLSSSEREKSYESQMATTKSIKSTSPTKVGEKKEGKGFFGQSNDFLNSIIAGGITNMLIKGGLIVGILYAIGKFFSSAEFRNGVFDMIGNLGKTIFGEEGWKDVKKNIVLGSVILLTGIVAVKSALLFLSQAIASAAAGIFGGGAGGGRGGRGRGRGGIGLMGLTTLAAGGAFLTSRMMSDSDGSTGDGGMDMSDKIGAAAGVYTAGSLAYSGLSKLSPGQYAKTPSTQTKTTSTPTEKTPTTKWGNFLKFVESKAPKLWAKIGVRLASASGLALVPIAGWIAAAINLGLAFWTVWELYELWQEFNKIPDASNSPQRIAEQNDMASEINRNTPPQRGLLEYLTGQTNSPTASNASYTSLGTSSSVGNMGDVDRVLNSIKGVESGGGDYNAKNPNSSASGAYQFLDGTWRDATKKYGIGQQYPTARSAPPEIQDAVARKSVEELMAKYNGDTNKVANVWYTGNPNGTMTAAGLAANRGFTSEQYRAKFQKFQNNSGGSLNQTSSAMLNNRLPSSNAPVIVDNSTVTNNNNGGGGGNNMSSSGVIDTELAKLLVERAIG